MQDTSLAPIALFVYNRPQHTLKTLEAIAANPLAKNSMLYIFADGAKKNADNTGHVNVQQVRRIIGSQQWCKEVIIETAKENKGLADSIVDGVTKVVEKHGRVIVIEDDILVSKGFLQYMNDALDFYEQEDKVMHVASYLPAINAELPSTFFYNSTSCWGWGTWASAWKNLNTDAEYLLAQLKEKNLLEAFTLEGKNDYLGQLNDNISGKLKTWAIKWNASVFLQGGLSLHPNESLVANTGLDGSGTNCQSIDDYNVQQLAEYVPVERIPLEESVEARNAFKRFLHDTLSLSFFARVRRKWRRSRA